VLSKCANPACSAGFHYLHEGRIFKFEMSAPSSDKSHSHNRRLEYFWLCERCVQTLTVVLENGSVTTRPLRLENAEGTLAEEYKKERDIA
jgi:hypothetical protein